MMANGYRRHAKLARQLGDGQIALLFQYLKNAQTGWLHDLCSQFTPDSARRRFEKTVVIVTQPMGRVNSYHEYHRNCAWSVLKNT